MIAKLKYYRAAIKWLWQDGTKTVVKVHDEPFDAEKGLTMAILKKLCGKAQLRKEFKKWITQN